MGSSYSSSQFPAEFSNQIYFSENVSLDEFSYSSPYSIKYVLTGYETYSVQGREFVIKPDQHLLVNNNSKVTLLPTSGKAVSIFIAPESLLDVKSILFAESLEKKLDNFGNMKETLFLLQERIFHLENARLHKILHRIKINILNSNYFGEIEIDPSLFFQLSEAILLDQHIHSTRLHTLTSCKRSTIQEQYNRLFIGYQYLNDNWNQPFSLKKTASTSHLSPFHFHRLFRTCFFKTPYQYHLEIQMNKALQLLKKNQHKISEIGYMLGYNSSTAFGRTFKRFFGISPSSFYK